MLKVKYFIIHFSNTVYIKTQSHIGFNYLPISAHASYILWATTNGNRCYCQVL